MFSLKNLNFACIKFRGPVLSQLLVYLSIFPKNRKIQICVSIGVFVCVRARMCMYV